MTNAAKPSTTPPYRIQNFSQRLLEWFDDNGRHDLPWQQNKTAYRVWVSEIMLQQTQVSAVIDYYQRFMTRFPELSDLAKASEEEVLNYWSGLGYYARGRNLLKAARTVQTEYGGKFPQDIETIQKLPGIGKSTAGAICSIAFKQSQAILDGNVKRVLTRLHDIAGWPGERKTEQALWELATHYTPEARCDNYTQAIMDMGATLCTRSKPRCNECPFEKDCLGLRNETLAQRPTSKPKKAKPTKEIWLLDIRHDNKRLLEKRPPSGIWGGLYSLPEMSREYLLEELEQNIEREYGFDIAQIEAGKVFEHIFSHYKLIAYPATIILKSGLTNEARESDKHFWMTKSEQNSVGLPAPIKKYLADQ